MRIACLALVVFMVFLSGCTKSYRLSVEGGTTFDFFATEHTDTSYGSRGSAGVVSLAVTDLTGIDGLEIGVNAVGWSGPYTDNTLGGANIGYRLANDSGYFVRASIGPYYGDTTVRTSSHWTFGFNAVVGMLFNDGKNELYMGGWHFSNGSSFDIGNKPNMGEEFFNCGVSFLF